MDSVQVNQDYGKLGASAGLVAMVDAARNF